MSKQKSETIGELYDQLSAITQWFEEASETDIDKAIKKYEEGVKIAKQIQGMVNKLENKITKVNKDFS